MLANLGEQAGITPACAGKSQLQSQLGIYRQDHPRMCGEKSGSPGSTRTHMGSPPHMRGKGSPSCCFQKQTGDHPRTCGEKCTCRGCSSPCVGSPPHMRGKELPLPDSDSPAGITPAHAGKSGLCSSEFSRRWDHPRVCGEKNSSRSLKLSVKGSPPRMRGKATKSANTSK